MRWVLGFGWGTENAVEFGRLCVRFWCFWRELVVVVCFSRLVRALCVFLSLLLFFPFA